MKRKGLKHKGVRILHVRIIRKNAPPPERGGVSWLVKGQKDGGVRYFIVTHTLHAGLLADEGEETAVFESDRRGDILSYELVLGGEDGGKTMSLMDAVLAPDDLYCYGRIA